MFKRPPADLALQSEGLCLRAPGPQDAGEALSDWLLGEDVAGMLNLRPGPWPVEVQAALFEAYRKLPGQLLLGLFDGGRMIGLFVITMNFDHGTFSMTHLIGSSQDRGKGASAKAIQMLLDYFFGELGFAKAKCNVKPGNGPVLWSLHVHGWTLEGRLEKHMKGRDGAARADLLCLAKFSSAWQPAKAAP